MSRCDSSRVLHAGWCTNQLMKCVSKTIELARFGVEVTGRPRSLRDPQSLQQRQRGEISGAHGNAASVQVSQDLSRWVSRDHERKHRHSLLRGTGPEQAQAPHLAESLKTVLREMRL